MAESQLLGAIILAAVSLLLQCVAHEISTPAGYGTFSVPLYNYNNEQYYALLKVGTPPQSFKVVLDTYGLTWLPSSVCKDDVCRNRSTFDASRSSTYRSSSDYVTESFGEAGVYGPIVTDRQQIGPAAFDDFTFLEGYEFRKGDNYRGVPFDGVLTVMSGSWAGSLFEHLAVNGLLDKPWLGFYFSDSVREQGEALFGGANERCYRAPLTFVQSNGAFWQFQMDGVQVGLTQLCFGGCSARPATAYPYIGAPTDDLRAINDLLEATPAAGGLFQYEVKCRGVRRLSDIRFTVGSRDLVLRPKDYIIRVDTPVGERCYSGFVESRNEAGVQWQLGHVFLRRFYTVLDLPELQRYGRVGFAYAR